MKQAIGIPTKQPKPSPNPNNWNWVAIITWTVIAYLAFNVFRAIYTIIF